MGYFDPNTYEWQPGDPNWLQTLASQREVEGQRPPPQVTPPPPSVAADPGGTFGYTAGREPQFVPNSASQGNRYGGSASYLNQLANAADIIRKSNAFTLPTRMHEESQQRLLQNQIDTAGESYNGNPETFSRIAGLQKILGMLKGSKQQPLSIDQVYTPEMDAAQKNQTAIEHQSRQEVTDRALADALGMPTPSGGTAPTPAQAESVFKHGIAKKEEARKQGTYEAGVRSREVLDQMRKVMTQQKERALRGDLTPMQANAMLKDAMKWHEALKNAQAVDPTDLSIADDIRQNQAHIDALQNRVSQASGAAPVTETPQKEPQSTGGLSSLWNMVKNGGPTFQSQQPDQPPQSRQQAPVSSPQAQGPVVMSNAIRKAKALSERVRGGNASPQETQLYERWMEGYTQALKMTRGDKQSALETSSRSIFGDF